jgi:deoxyribose-phosphate aldolase
MSTLELAPLLTVSDIAYMCDHSLLRPTLADQEFVDGIAVARQYCCRTVMVAPYDVTRAVGLLQGSPVEVSTVIDFPHGSNLTEAKVFEAHLAMDRGARHLDMVMAVSRAVAGHFDEVECDIRGVAAAAHSRGVPLKVILEICYLTPEMIVEACRAAERAGADFVKTSTGYGPGGATLAAVRLMRQSVGPAVAVKAAGGIRTLDEVLAYRQAGASMIGSRATAAILNEAEQRQQAGNLRELEN